VTRHEVSPPEPSGGPWSPRPRLEIHRRFRPGSVRGLAESEDAAFRTVRGGLGSLKLVPGRGLTILGEPSPFWVDPLDEGGDDDEGAVPMLAPGVLPKLELPRGVAGSSSLQPKAARSATANATLGEEVSVQSPWKCRLVTAMVSGRACVLRGFWRAGRLRGRASMLLSRRSLSREEETSHSIGAAAEGQKKACDHIG
jgi:hypothetical protein